ncbi:hypothetical protein [Salegentibacter flavus]|uniref:hypothetical protein n=1 Tax=Salegentibacter flavus TaxID=287099 RepID=UPI000B806C30|nr:hypothetical protein [Salegentibacter flavus]
MEKWCLIYALPVSLKSISRFKKRQTSGVNHPNPQQCTLKSIFLYDVLEKYFRLLLLMSSPSGYYYDLLIFKLNKFSLKEFSAVAFIPANFRF